MKTERGKKNFLAPSHPVYCVSFSISVSAPVSSWFHQSAATVRPRHLLKVTLSSDACSPVDSWSVQPSPVQSQTILELLQVPGNFLSLTDSSSNKPWGPWRQLNHQLSAEKRRVNSEHEKYQPVWRCSFSSSPGTPSTGDQHNEENKWVLQTNNLPTKFPSR